MEFATGIWYGVELDDAVGKNNGTLKGKTYFKCADKHGMFARKVNVKLVAKGAPGAKKVATANVPRQKAKEPSPIKKAAPAAAKPKAAKPSPTKAPAKAAPAPAPDPARAPAPAPVVPAPAQTVPRAALDAASATLAARNAAAVRAAQTGMVASGVDPAVVERLKDELEAATLDKQLAELKLEEAQEDLLDLQSQVSGLEAKAATSMVGGGGGGGGADATQLKHAIEAVVKFRDELIMKDEYISEMEGVLREERRACQRAEFALAQKTEQLDGALKRLGGMREQLDETSGSSGMVEDMSSKLGDLEEANTQMQGEIADLVSLISLNDTIIEEHRQAEMDALDALESLEQEYAQLGDAVKQVHSDNMRYKRAYHDIKREMEELEEANPKAAAAAAAVSDPESSVGGDESAVGPDGVAAAAAAEAGPSIEEVERATKALAAKVELELKDLEAKNAKTHLSMLKLFLPESFNANENSGIEVAMFLKNVGEKSKLIRKMTEKQFRAGENPETLLNSAAFTATNLSFAHEFLTLITQLESACTSLSTGLATADDAAYKALASLHGELKAHGPAVDEILDVVQTASLGPSVPLEGLQGALKQFQRAQDLNPTITFGDNEVTGALLQQLLNITTSLYVELRRVEEIFSKTTVDGNKDSAFAEMNSRIQVWQATVQEMAKNLRKAVRGLPDPATNGTVLKAETRAMLEKSVAAMSLITTGLRATGAACWDHMRGSATLKALSVGQADQFASKALVDLTEDGVHTTRLISQGAEESKVPGHFKIILAETIEAVQGFVKAMEFGELDGPVVPPTKVAPPWETRGNKMRAQIAESLAMESIVEEKQALIMEEKAKAAKLKKEISVFTVKLAGATKQVDSAKSDLQVKIDNLKGQLEEAEESLGDERADRAADVANLEEALTAAEQKVEELKKKMEFAPKKAHALVDMRSARIKLDTMEQALRVARGELATLRGDKARQSLAVLKPLIGDTKLAESKELADVSSKTNAYLKKLHALIASPVVVDITQKGAGKKSAAAQLAQQASRVAKLRVEKDALATEAERMLATRAVGGDAGSSFSKFVSPEFLKVLKERKDGRKAATIRAPAGSSGMSGARIDVSASQLSMLHNALLAC